MASTLLERDAEIAEIRRLATDSTAGQGRIVLVEGPAGIGKTALLQTARDAGEAAGALVAAARASELDRQFAFGVVHQLLEPVLAGADEERRARLLAGAAAHAETVFEPSSACCDEPEYAVLHGLYWFLVNLAEEQPVLLVVDDLHWADSSSLRALEYLGRRLEGLRAGLVASVRPAEPGAHALLIDEIGAGPFARRLRPRALSAEAAGALLADGLDAAPDPAFADAALEATGGNPLLLTIVAREAAALGLRGGAEDAPALAMLAARGVAPAVDRRLRSLGHEARGVARTAAVAGERATFDDVAALAGLGAGATRSALDQLAAVGILQAGGWTFLHPLVRTAVEASTPTADRLRMHRRLAQRLRTRGARPAEVAVHLLAAEAVGDEDAVDCLRAAARTAAAEGAPQTAAEYLRRALDEPPPVALRPKLLLELGEMEVRAGAPEALARIEEAIERGLSGDDLVRARVARGTHLVHSDPVAALDDFEGALETVGDSSLRLRVEALALEASVFHRALSDRRRRFLEEARSRPDPSPVLLAHLAMQSGYSGAPVGETLGLVERALAGGDLLRHVGPGSSTWNLLVHAVRYAEDAERARRMIAEGEALVRAQGIRSASFFVDHAWAYWHLDFGSIATGAAHARTGLEQARQVGLPMAIWSLAAVAAEALLQLDQVDEAAAILGEPTDGLEDTIAEPFLVSARGLVRHYRRDSGGAEADFRHVVALADGRGWQAPYVTEARLRLATLLATRGDRDEALELVTADLARARHAGTAGALGAVQRVHALLLDDDDAIAVLREAAEILDGTAKHVLRGWALHDLGALLRRRGHRRDAREPLRQALDLAARVESTRLARSARAELAAAGAQPRRDLLSGVASLTPSERRIADLAASGLTNREIAETLFVTLKTVEVHLGHTYAKLGIRSRAQLPDALGVAQPEPAAA
ncbi:MAG TPA: AAA family ATPase [Solirubrobacteraceae bacterium]|nr:AAA family ATPase [Solirubrobacteraceae bacterium]